jgi:hypothetical protein
MSRAIGIVRISQSFDDIRLEPKELLDLADRWLVTIEWRVHRGFSQQHDRCR